MTNQPPRPPDDRDATLRPPQFSLRAILIGTTVAAVLLTVMMSLGALWSLAILFFVTLISAHVIGNSLGTRLRNGATAQIVMRPAARRPAQVANSVHASRPSRLHEHRRLHWIHFVLALVGALTGGYYGGTALAETYPDATTSAHVLAYVSSGVLGGFAVFAISSFFAVVRQAISEAHAGSDRRRSVPSPHGADSVDRN